MKQTWNKEMRSVLLPLVCLSALLLVNTSYAGIIVIPGAMMKDGTLAPSGASAPGLSVHYSKTAVTLSSKACEVTMTETVGCGAEGVKAVGIIPLPKGTKAGTFTASIGGRQLTTTYLTAAKARPIYEAIAKASGKTMVLSHADRPALLLPELELSKRLEIMVGMSLPVGSAQNLAQTTVPMPEASFYGSPVMGVSVTVDVTGTDPIRGIFSPSHEIRIDRKNLRNAEISANFRNYTEGNDLRLFFAEDVDPLGMRLLTYHDADEKDGYFMLFGNPTGSDRKEASQPKDIVFALDVSGSMRGEKMEQARSAITHCLKRLNKDDRFNVIAFGTEVTRFKPEPVTAEKKTITDALVFVDELISHGRTNIAGALEAALKGSRENSRPSFLIFLTDGTPTVGERDPKKILETVAALNATKKKIFVVGVGHDVNAHLLGKLAMEHDGTSVYVSPNEAIDETVAALFNRLKNPVLSEVKVDFGEFKTYGAFPRKIPTLFKGTDLVRFGRYSGGGKQTISIAGRVGALEKRYSYTFDFPEKGSSKNDFVASLWATRKIGFLLQNLRLNGENNELLEEVVRLSKKFGIVTEYTSFLADSDMSLERANEMASKKMKTASTVSSGKWAVMQAKNDMEMQGRMVAEDSANAYVDRNGRRKTVNVKRVSGRTFYQRDGVWEEAGEKTDQKMRKVKKFSDEYFKLVKTNKAFAEAQKLNGKMSMTIDNERVVVEE